MKKKVIRLLRSSSTDFAIIFIYYLDSVEKCQKWSAENLAVPKQMIMDKIIITWLPQLSLKKP
jgi:hypothetical protein